MYAPHSRRDVLKAAGTAGVLALAGCTSSAESDGTPTGHDDHGTDAHHDEGTSSPTHHDHEGHSHGEIEGPNPSAEVRMITTDAGTHFDPHVVWVEAGGTVTWVNESGSHSATAYAPANDRPQRIPDGAEAFDSGTLTEEGATFEVTFDTPGVYDYYCIPHEGAGMIGSVIVGEPDAHGQPGLAEPQESLPEGAREKIHSLNEQVNEALGHTHDESTATEDGHDDGSHHENGTATGDGHDDGGHHDGTATGTEHHDG